MEAGILCTLIADRIDPTYFQLHGLEVHWMAEEYDTIENNATVADVVANYDTLEAAYLAEQQAVEDAKLARAQEIIDNLPDWPIVRTAVQNISNLAEAKVFIEKLARVVYIQART